MDKLRPEQRHKNMSHIKNKDSKIECKLRKALWQKGKYKQLSGKPNIVLTKYKIAVFCDSEFFHGKDFVDLKKMEKSSNSDFWIAKIEKNIKRDEEVNELLRSQGWRVIRFLGKDIIKDIDGCVASVEEAAFEKMQELS